MGLLDYSDELIETVNRWNGQIGAPSAENRQKNRIRVFKNRIIEDWFATSHPILPGVWFGGFIVYGLYLALTSPALGLVQGVGLYALGVLLWTLIEYLLHRFVFHWDPGQEFKAKVRLFLMHGYHHEFPNDKWRLVAPPVMSWPLAAVVALVYYLVSGPDRWLVLFGGTTAGYLAYDWIHYYTHHFSPKWWVGKVLRRSHMVHHFKLFPLNMGISSPLWDFVFGTFAWSESAIKEAMEEERTVKRAG